MVLDLRCGHGVTSVRVVHAGAARAFVDPDPRSRSAHDELARYPGTALAPPGPGYHDRLPGRAHHEVARRDGPAQREILDRLPELNHARYAEEVAAGLYDKKAREAKPAKNDGALF